MIDVLDTNIFILAIYSPLHKKAVHKFITEQKSQIPYSLYTEILNHCVSLLSSLQKIQREYSKGVSYSKIEELMLLERNYDNGYDFLKQKSNDFKNNKNFEIALNEGIGMLYTIDSWAYTVKYYPENEIVEKNIIQKYAEPIKKLLGLDSRLHPNDLNILFVLKHCYKLLEVRFVTRDKNTLLIKKEEIEKELATIKLIKVAEYLA